jgi:hypothetical protein
VLEEETVEFSFSFVFLHHLVVFTSLLFHGGYKKVYFARIQSAKEALLWFKTI